MSIPDELGFAEHLRSSVVKLASPAIAASLTAVSPSLLADLPAALGGADEAIEAELLHHEEAAFIADYLGGMDHLLQQSPTHPSRGSGVWPTATLGALDELGMSDGSVPEPLGPPTPANGVHHRASTSSSIYDPALPTSSNIPVVDDSPPRPVRRVRSYSNSDTHTEDSFSPRNASLKSPVFNFAKSPVFSSPGTTGLTRTPVQPSGIAGFVIPEMPTIDLEAASRLRGRGRKISIGSSSSGGEEISSPIAVKRNSGGLSEAIAKRNSGRNSGPSVKVITPTSASHQNASSSSPSNKVFDFAAAGIDQNPSPSPSHFPSAPPPAATHTPQFDWIRNMDGSIRRVEISPPLTTTTMSDSSAGSSVSPSIQATPRSGVRSIASTLSPSPISPSHLTGGSMVIMNPTAPMRINRNSGPQTSPTAMSVPNVTIATPTQTTRLLKPHQEHEFVSNVLSSSAPPSQHSTHPSLGSVTGVPSASAAPHTQTATSPNLHSRQWRLRTSQQSLQLAIPADGISPSSANSTSSSSGLTMMTTTFIPQPPMSPSNGPQYHPQQPHSPPSALSLQTHSSVGSVGSSVSASAVSSRMNTSSSIDSSSSNSVFEQGFTSLSINQSGPHPHGQLKVLRPNRSSSQESTLSQSSESSISTPDGNKPIVDRVSSGPVDRVSTPISIHARSYTTGHTGSFISPSPAASAAKHGPSASVTILPSTISTPSPILSPKPPPHQQTFNADGTPPLTPPFPPSAIASASPKLQSFSLKTGRSGRKINVVIGNTSAHAATLSASSSGSSTGVGSPTPPPFPPSAPGTPTHHI